MSNPMNGAPGWRRLYDAIEHEITPRLESLVRTSQFASAAALAATTRARARREIDAASARLWHLANLPAGTDIQRLRTQLGSLDRDVRQLMLQLERLHDEQAEGGENHAATAGPRRGTRSGPPGD